MVGAEEKELRGIEQKILKKYGGSALGKQEIWSGADELSSSLQTQPDLTSATKRTFGSDSDPCPISICSVCGGVGKTYETVNVGQPGGIQRIIESCCTACNGQCYVSKLEVRTILFLFFPFLSFLLLLNPNIFE